MFNRNIKLSRSAPVETFFVPGLDRLARLQRSKRQQRVVSRYQLTQTRSFTKQRHRDPVNHTDMQTYARGPNAGWERWKVKENQAALRHRKMLERTYQPVRSWLLSTPFGFIPYPVFTDLDHPPLLTDLDYPDTPLTLH